MALARSEIRPMKNDFGRWAEHYVSIPYDHYRAEVYGLFVDVFKHVKSLARVLDVGAGPGHLAFEYFNCLPMSDCRFVLLDASREMLRAAQARFASRPGAVAIVCRTYNSAGWADGLGKFDAITSNNSLFHLRPPNLRSFYRVCFERLKASGVLLNQQAFGYESRNSPRVHDGFSEIIQMLPDDILPQYSSSMSDVVKRELSRKKIAAGKRRVGAMRKAIVAGLRIAESDEHQYLTAEKHLESMREAGFSAGCIWQKRDFAVLMGVKGRPF
jgi:SAM-dependent methyltransferase